MASTPAHARTNKTPSPPLDQWFTDPVLAGYLVDWARIGSDDRVLEAGAGDGAIARWVPRPHRLTLVELDDGLVDGLVETFVRREDGAQVGATVIHGDFLETDFPLGFDVVVGNPPFTYVDAIDARFARRALEVAPRVVYLARAQFFHTKTVDRIFWSRARLTRKVDLGRRAFRREDGYPSGGSALSDFVLFEAVRREPGDEGPWSVEYERWVVED